MTSKITRKKGQAGKADLVQCVQCGKMTLWDKVVEKHKSTLPLDHRLRKFLKNQGAYISGIRSIVYYCVSCAKHRKYM